MESTRLTRGEYYISIAAIVAKRSTCPRASVGAILVDPLTNRIVATGYNGSVAGSPHCTDVGCMMQDDHCLRTVHAEINAVLHLEHGYQDLHLYCTHQPCWQCYKALVTANVSRVFYRKEYIDPVREKLMMESGHLIVFSKI